MQNELELLRPLGSLNTAAPDHTSLYDFFEVLVRCASYRQNSCEITCELVRSDPLSFLAVQFSPKMRQQEFQNLLLQADPAIFARGNIGLLVTENELLEADIDFAKSSDPRSNRIRLKCIEPPKIIHFSQGTLIFKGVDGKDAVNWGCIEERAIIVNTLLGNRKPPNVKIRLCHTGPERVIVPRWEWEIIVEENSRSVDLSLKKPFSRSMVLDAGIGDAIAWCVVGFDNPAIHRIRVCDSHRLYSSLAGRLDSCFDSKLRNAISPRLKRRISWYFEVALPKFEVPDPLGELASQHIRAIENGATHFVDMLLEWEKFKDLVVRSDEHYIVEEDKELTRRKMRSTNSRKVYFKKDNDLFLLHREPKNEQDVVLLTSMLCQHKVFPVSDFLDYETYRGIDAVMRLKLTPDSKQDEDAIVEFKHALEDFLNELHPLSLIDVIIAWDVDRKKFDGSRYRLTEPAPGRKWLRRLEDRKSEHQASVVLLKYLDGVIVQ